MDAERAHRPADLLVIGGVSTDRITVEGRTRTVAGGAGLYAALGAVAAGARPALVGLLTDDLDPDVHRSAELIDLSQAVRIPGHRMRFAIDYDTTQQAHYRVDDAQAEQVITPEQAAAAHPGCAAVHLCPTSTLARQVDTAAAIRARRPATLIGATTFLHRLREEPDQGQQLLGLVDALVCSVEEAKALTAAESLPTALGALAAREPSPRLVCVTDGPRAIHLIGPIGPTVVLDPPRVQAVDPTGAGESFAGALLADLSRGVPALSAVRHAAQVAARTVGGWGPTALLPGSARSETSSVRTTKAEATP